MKPHIILELTTPLPDVAHIPHWQRFITNRQHAVVSVTPEIDAVFRQYALPFWVTTEYSPAQQQWSPEEIAAGFNRIYRLILQHDTAIPANLIQSITLLPTVRQIRVGRIAAHPLPESRQASLTDRIPGQQSREEIFLGEAHGFTQGDPRVVIAVLDTGINLNHPELAHCLLPGYDFVDIIDGADKFIGDYLGIDKIPEDAVGHGTHVAGIIAGKGINMPVGVAPKCKILPVRVLGAMKQDDRLVGAGLIDNINVAIKWAVDHGASIINMSLGIKHTEGGLPHAEVVEYAHKKGVSIVAASGNDGTDEQYYPGALPHVIAVGATDTESHVAFFSTYGQQVSFVAPGTDIYSSFLDNGYAFSTGTSHAAPFVAGALALLKSYSLKKRGKAFSDNQVKYLLKNTADKVDRRFKHYKAGFGKLNLVDALKLSHHKMTKS